MHGGSNLDGIEDLYSTSGEIVLLLLRVMPYSSVSHQAGPSSRL